MTENRLLDAVDELSAPIRHRQPQDILSDGKVVGQQHITVILPSLLDQMDAAIRSSMGGSTSGGSLAHERSILDTDALFKLMRMASQIRDWCHIRKVVPTGDAGKDLRAWYTASLPVPMPVESEEAHARILTRWAGEIRAKLDPWREKDLPDECPVCGAGDWWRDGERFLRPLIIRYRPDGPDMVQQSRAMCRSCEQVWTVRELAFEIEERDKRHAEHVVVADTA